MRKVWTIAWYEARMSSRGWRFWLLLSVLGGLSFFARADYLARVDYGFYLHSAYSFQHPSFWLMMATFALGAVALTLDASGRLRQSRMDKILFPLPVSTMAIIWGRLLGVLIVIIPLSVLGIFSLGLWQYLYGHGLVVWQPFLIAFLLLVIPIVLPLVALTITVRTYIKHDFIALLAGTVIAVVLIYTGAQYHLWLDVREIIQRLTDSSPTIGARVALGKYWIQIAVHVLVSLSVLYLAPLYFRRQEPQRWIVNRHKATSMFSIDTLLQWISYLRFDRHLGFGYRISALLVLSISTAGVVWAAYHYQEILKANERDRGEETVVQLKLPDNKLDVFRYRLNINPSRTYDRLKLEASMDFVTNIDSRFLAFELDPIFQIDEIVLNGKPCSFARQESLLRVALSETITPENVWQLSIRYHGVPYFFHPRYSALQSVWYPKPWFKIRAGESRRWIETEDDLFDAELTLRLQRHQRGAFAGSLIQVDDTEDARIEQWHTLYPVNSLQLFWGDYSYIEENKFGYTVRFFHLPGHDYQSWVYLEEVEEQQGYVHDKLGQLPFPQLTLIEIPYLWIGERSEKGEWKQPWLKREAEFPRIDSRHEMPGIIVVAENSLSYLHEKIWDMQRYDRDPKAIPFFRVIPYILYELNEQFYTKLISAYFDHSLHPEGDLAFWVNEYLSSYSSKLLDRNPWRRRRELNYDIGTGPHLPLSVAQRDNLLELHRNGRYPELERVRGEGLFRMLHHLMGDEAWWGFLKELFQQYRFRKIPVADFLPLAEEFYGDSLAWFVEQWILGAALPEYEITFAEARIVENKNNNQAEYQTVIRVRNHGTGRMKVPVYIETEMDFIFRDLWLDGMDEQTLSIVVPHRPLFAMIDPENWVVQLPFYDSLKKNRLHSERRIDIQGEEASALARNQKRNNDRRRFYRRGPGHW